MFKLVKITGNSMSPTLRDGDYVITKKPRRLASGLVYVIDHIDLGIIVKRLKTVEGNRLHFSGDNPASTPEALLGHVTPDRIQRQVLCAITPKGLKRL